MDIGDKVSFIEHGQQHQGRVNYIFATGDADYLNDNDPERRYYILPANGPQADFPHGPFRKDEIEKVIS